MPSLASLGLYKKAFRNKNVSLSYILGQRLKCRIYYKKIKKTVSSDFLGHNVLCNLNAPSTLGMKA